MLEPQMFTLCYYAAIKCLLCCYYAAIMLLLLFAGVFTVVANFSTEDAPITERALVPLTGRATPTAVTFRVKSYRGSCHEVGVGVCLLRSRDDLEVGHHWRSVVADHCCW